MRDAWDWESVRTRKKAARASGGAAGVAGAGTQGGAKADSCKADGCRVPAGTRAQTGMAAAAGEGLGKAAGKAGQLGQAGPPGFFGLWVGNVYSETVRSVTPPVDVVWRGRGHVPCRRGIGPTWGGCGCAVCAMPWRGSSAQEGGEQVTWARMMVGRGIPIRAWGTAARNPGMGHGENL